MYTHHVLLTVNFILLLETDSVIYEVSHTSPIFVLSTNSKKDGPFLDRMPDINHRPVLFRGFAVET